MFFYIVCTLIKSLEKKFYCNTTILQGILVISPKSSLRFHHKKCSFISAHRIQTADDTVGNSKLRKCQFNSSLA